MKEIALTRGLVTQVDDWNFKLLNQYNWFALKSRNAYYAVRWNSRTEGKRKYIFMHKVIKQTPDYLQCDHKDLNSLNNQEYNLRNATHSQNRTNSIQSTTNEYRGVSYNTLNKKWQCRITINGKQKHLGYFTDPINAAQKYDKFALKYQGEFAITNFN